MRITLTCIILLLILKGIIDTEYHKIEINYYKTDIRDRCRERDFWKHNFETLARWHGIQNDIDLAYRIEKNPIQRRK